MCRKLLAVYLEGGDVVQEECRKLIMSKMDTIVEKLEGSARKDLLTSLSHFKKGLEFYNEALSLLKADMYRDQLPSRVKQAAAVFERNEAQAVDWAAVTEAKLYISRAEEVFKLARDKATEAFWNENLDIDERILATKIRVMSQLGLKEPDEPAGIVVKECTFCLKELNSLQIVHNTFANYLRRGKRWSFIRGTTRKEVVESVVYINTVVFEFAKETGESKELSNWPEIGGKGSPIHPMANFELRKMEQPLQCIQAIDLSFGIKFRGSACQAFTLNSEGQYVVVSPTTISVFGLDGESLYWNNIFSGHSPLNAIATDRRNNIYVANEGVVRVYNNQAQHIQLKFGQAIKERKTEDQESISEEDQSVWGHTQIAITENNKVFMLVRFGCDYVIERYSLSGILVSSHNKAGLVDMTGPNFDCSHITANRHELVLTDAVSRKHVHVDVACEPWKRLHSFSSQGSDSTGKSKKEQQEIQGVAFSARRQRMVILSSSTSGSTSSTPRSILEIVAMDGNPVETHYLDELCSSVAIAKDGRIFVLVKETIRFVNHFILM